MKRTAAFRTILPCVMLAHASMASGQGGIARVAPQYRPVGDVMFLGTRDLGQAAAGAGRLTAVAATQTRMPRIAPPRRPAGEVSFRSVLDLNQDVGASQPMLRGAMMIANSRDWQASLYTTFESAEGPASCTAALVGPQAVLTAAHCVPDSRRIQIEFTNRNYGAVCDVHPQYADQSDDSADYALCRVDRPVAVPPDIQFETINTGSINGLLGQRLVLGGYGCTSDLVRENEVDGQYRIGLNNVEETSNSPARRYGDDLYSGREDNNLFTSDEPELANVCPGDSGGPAFEARAGDDGLYGRRSIVGVNSRVFYRDFNDDGTPRSYGASLISATGGPDFRSWALAWAARARVPVCGLVSGVPNCRN